MPRHRKGSKKAKTEPRPVKAEPLTDNMGFWEVARKLASPDPDKRYRFRRLLRRIGATEEQLAMLRSDLVSGQGIKAREVATILAILRDKESVPILISRLGKVKEIHEALGDIGVNEEQLQTIRDLSRSEDEDPDRRMAAIRALGRLKDRESVPYLIRAMREVRDDWDQDLIYAFADALGHIGDERALPELIDNVLDSDGGSDIEISVAISMIYPDEERLNQYRTLSQTDGHPDRLKATFALGLWEDGESVPVLLRFVEEGRSPMSIAQICSCLNFIGDKRAVPVLGEKLIELAIMEHERDTGGELVSPSLEVDDSDLEDIAFALKGFGDVAIRPLKKALRITRRRDLLEEPLKELGVPEGEIDRIMNEGKHVEDPVLPSTPQGMARKILEKRNAKQMIFENAKVFDVLPDRQAWITINSPELAKRALSLALEHEKKRNALDKALHSVLGFKSKGIREDHLTYYADEILDAVNQVFGQMRDVDPELGSALSEIRYGNGIRLRYVKREESDLRLGDKCGDCTATGSVHHDDSIMWLVNPAYQILKMSKGKRFIGKVNFTLGNIDGEDAVIIDALEFNPQATKGKPYYQDGLECLDGALGFLKELAAKEGRGLYALTVSNSSGAVEILYGKGIAILEPGEEARRKNEMPIPYENEGEYFDDIRFAGFVKSQIGVRLLVPHNDIARILHRVPKKEIKLYYQMLGAEVKGKEQGSRDLLEDKLPILENEVINPAQIESEGVAAAMRARDFMEASKLILADERWAEKVKEIFELSFDISPVFLSKKLERIYKEESRGLEELERHFAIDPTSFVKLS